EVPDPPALTRPERIELDAPPPATRAFRAHAPRGGHDEADRPPVGKQPELVIPEREVGRQRTLGVEDRAVLEPDLRPAGQAATLAGLHPSDYRRPGRRRVG